jgi:hypothetical protein
MSDNSGLISDALTKSNPALALSVDAANAYKSEVKQQGARVALFRDYERGDHRAGITDQMKKMLRLPTDDSGITDFNGNYCNIVIDKMASRLKVSEVTTGNDPVDKDWLTPLLERNDFDNLQSTTFRGALRDADSYVMVDPQTLAWTSEPAYDGYSGVVCIFEPGSRTPLWACKMWSEAEDSGGDNTMRLVVYQPGSVSYWRGQAGASEVQPDNDAALAARMQTKRMIDAEGMPITDNSMPFPVSRTPIVHYANKYENYSETGESELRGAIPLQDVYNRTLHSMIMASEFSAFRVAYSIGMEMDVNGYVPGAVINLVLKDSAGNVINEPSAEMLSFLQAVKVGQFEATDMGQYINQLDNIVREISQATQTPIYGVTTSDGALSGEALKQLEIGLIGKVQRFQTQNVDAIRELIQLTAEIQNAFNTGLGSAPAFDKVSVTWKSPEILDVTTQVTALVAMRRDAPGLWSDDFYRGKIGGMLGMSQNEVKAEVEAVKKQKAEALRNRVNTVRVPVSDDGQVDGRKIAEAVSNA